MKLDTAGEGLEAIFKEYQAIIVKKLHDGETMTSGQAWRYINKILKETGKSISRASVIFFLNDLVDDGLLEYEEKTGKGGYHKVYKMTLTRTKFAHKITGWFIAKLLEAFPEPSKTFMWPRP